MFMKLVTFVRQRGQRMRALTESQFPYEGTIIVQATSIGIEE